MISIGGWRTGAQAGGGPGVRSVAARLPRDVFGANLPWPGWRRLPLVAPATVCYLALAWGLYLVAADPVSGTFPIDRGFARDYVYVIPDLGEDFSRALRSLVTAPFLNNNRTQIVYVTALLLLFGARFEACTGAWRAVALFFGTSCAGALFAGGLLYLVYPRIIDNAFLAHAWEGSWSGGSAGCFGLMGAAAARSPRPWRLIGLVVLWEISLMFWYLRGFTPAFHLSALVVGFVGARYLTPRMVRSRSSRPLLPL